MSLRNTLLASSSRFSHFFSGSSARRAEGQGDEAPEAARAEEEEDASRAEGDEATDDRPAPKRRRAKKAKRAKARQPEDDEDPDGDDAADDDEDDEDEGDMKKAATAGHEIALDAAYRMGARAQRRRCAVIFADAAAAAHPALAMTFAFETHMTAEAAIAALKRQPPQAGAALPGVHGRMANSPAGTMRVPPSSAEGPRGAAAIAASWDRALKAV